MKKLNAFSIVAFVLSIWAIECALYILLNLVYDFFGVAFFLNSVILFYVYMGSATVCAAVSIALAYMAKDVQKKVFKIFNKIAMILSIVALALLLVYIIITVLKNMGIIMPGRNTIGPTE